MSRLASLSLNFLMVLVALAAIVAPRDLSAETARSSPTLAQVGAAELQFGSFSNVPPGATTPTAFVWSYDDNGTQIEVWALFRPNTANGWTFPGANQTSVELCLDYEGAPAHTSIAAFMQWCQDQYPASMSVDKAVDFEVHKHTVEVIQS